MARTAMALPDEKSQMRGYIEISRVVAESIVDHSIGQPVKSYQQKVAPTNWIVTDQCQNTRTVSITILFFEMTPH